MDIRIICVMLVVIHITIIKLGHTFNEDEKKPNCLEGGFTTYHCEACDYSYQGKYTIPLGHSYTENKISATCSSYGFTEHLCSVCNDRYVTDYIKPLGHEFFDVLIN